MEGAGQSSAPKVRNSQIAGEKSGQRGFSSGIQSGARSCECLANPSPSQTLRHPTPPQSLPMRLSRYICTGCLVAPGGKHRRRARVLRLCLMDRVRPRASPLSVIRGSF